MAVNDYTNRIYVANEFSNTLTVIDGFTDKKLRDISVGDKPTSILIYNNLIYVVNSGEVFPHPGTPSTVSVIDGSTDKVAAGVTFNIRPANGGNIWCNNREYPTNIYLYVPTGTTCIARPTKDFEFSSWVENLDHNSTIPLNQSAISASPWNSFLSIFGKPYDASATFDVNRFGTFTANFKPVPPPVPAEYWIPLYGIIVSTIVGWSIPSIIGSIKTKMQGRRVNGFHERTRSLYTPGGLDETDIASLDTLKGDISDTYAKGKITEQQYTNLNNEVSVLYEGIYQNRIDSINELIQPDSNRKRELLNNVKKRITDAYAKGKITEQHYCLLKEKIANFSDTGNHSST
jgi:YVTN family beta-propeller protein